MAKRRISREQKEAYRDIVSGSEVINEIVNEEMRRTDDPETLEALERILHTNNQMIVRLVKLLIVIAIIGGAVITLL